MILYDRVVLLLIVQYQKDTQSIGSKYHQKGLQTVKKFVIILFVESLGDCDRYLKHFYGLTCCICIPLFDFNIAVADPEKPEEIRVVSAAKARGSS